MLAINRKVAENKPDTGCHLQLPIWSAYEVELVREQPSVHIYHLYSDILAVLNTAYSISPESVTYPVCLVTALDIMEEMESSRKLYPHPSARKYKFFSTEK